MRSLLYTLTFIVMNFTADCVDTCPWVERYEISGSTVHLSLGRQLNMTQLKWRKANELIAKIENQNPSIRIKEKYILEVSNGSLTILNVSEDDSGEYKAENGQWEIPVIGYRMIVQAAVSDPIITTRPLHLNLTAVVCHVLVNCSADGETAMYHCDLQHCTQISSLPVRVNITVTASNDGKVECVVSNRVSTKTRSSTLTTTCQEKEETSVSTSESSLILLVLVCPLILGILGVFLLLKVYCSRKKPQIRNMYADSDISTVYSVVHKRCVPTDNAAASCPTTTVYDVPKTCVRWETSTRY
ncbi:uncharacterized protein LOC143475401 isoform X2 [Brachyhypopomus gauderio]|uniref:uncharacterized protein LOC143475401 isoform X2 n=1 Tax=Brachyhypopomus gauderio TaxID=698409 RepID=UPI004043041B